MPMSVIFCFAFTRFTVVVKVVSVHNIIEQTYNIEQNFLTLSSLIITDKEELIKQLQSIGENLNHSTATFFLDMANRNLQEAAGRYFNFMAQLPLPSMMFLSDITVGKGEKITPTTTFQLSFMIQNNGETTWLSGTYMTLKQDLHFLQSYGTAPGWEANQKFYVHTLPPMDTVSVTVQLVSPAEEGPFQTTWAIYTPFGVEFGETITVTIEVCKNGTMAITQANGTVMDDLERWD
ncbi:protein ILRUN-like [Anopheles bellator]|uniref:protein ILRUN-like n=1 Tax=Anopheles bellator TaxID=139047 RepID=UPI00264A1366|nr:protein ILRUN-like [Anopheles bellator]